MYCKSQTIDLSEMKEIWKNLIYEEQYEDLEDEEVLNILADEEIINTVRKYDGDVAKTIAGYIIDSIFFLKDKETIIKMTKIISTYEGQYAESTALSLCDVLNTLEKPDAKKFIDWSYEAKISEHDTFVGYHFYDELKDTISKSKECNAKEYSFEEKNGDCLNYSKEELVRYSIISIIGSTDKALKEEAENSITNIVGKTVLNKAKNEFNNKYKSDLFREIVNNFRQQKYEKAYEILNNTKNNTICDVLNSANYKDVDIRNSNFIRATESNNPLDYDNRTHMACVYLPLGEDNEEIIRYCNDESVVLVRYDIGGESLGSSICFIQDDTFLVDSVEGHRTTRKDKVFEIIYNDLIYRARMKNAKRIIFNRNVFNETPIKFIEYIGKKGLDNTIIDMDIDIYTLEAADEENTKGYLIELKE